MPDALAPETAPESAMVYNVSASSPAIPMNAFSVVNTENIAIEMDGKFVRNKNTQCMKIKWKTFFHF